MRSCIEFDPVNKAIFISEDMTMVEVYSAWKLWAHRNPQYEPGICSITGTFNGQLKTIFILVNEWQIDVPDNKCIHISGEILQDDGLSIIKSRTGVTISPSAMGSVNN